MSINLNSIKSDSHVIRIADSAGVNELAINASGKITAIVEDGGGSITVDGTIAATQSGTWNIGTITSITNAVNIADGGNSITVDAVGLDIRDLTHASDSVKVGDGTEFLAINADGSINVQTFTGGFSTYKVSAEAPTSIESELVSTPLANRLCIEVQNVGNRDVYIREATGVTTSNGFLIPSGGSYDACLDAGANLFAISESGTADLRVIEYAA